jgi:hypothetical protein
MHVSTKLSDVPQLVFSFWDADPGCLYRIRNCSISDPGPRVKWIPDPGSGFASKNLSVLTQKIVYKLS